MARTGETFRRVQRDERGAILLFVMVLLVVTFGMAALAVDLGRGYVVHMRLARAVDAGTLAGARAIRLGQSTARAEALRIAELNGADALDGVDISVSFGVNQLGEHTITMTASRVVPTVFAKIIGFDELPVRAEAAAAVPPVDLALVLDQSYSLAQNYAWDDLQAAAKRFVSNFSDGIDMVGMSSFHARAVDRVPLGSPFTINVSSAIDNMRSAGYTNTGEGLRTAFEQMQNAPLRNRSVKVVVFFTDGRPTAIRGLFDGVDRVLVVPGDLSATRITGYYNYGTLVEDPSPPVQNPYDGCRDVYSCFGLTEDQIRAQARQNGIDWADQIRRADYLLYTIGLGNPRGGAAPPPDLDYLRLLANEAGVANPNQPKGRMYFAPSAAELQEVFDQLAQDLLVHLTR